jgi:D-sedoheptulose 7-phosphate isomerase
MDYYRIIADNFQGTIETIAMSVDNLAESIEHGGQAMAGSLLQDGKIIACGNGVDAALAQLFACNLLNRLEEDRPALPALTLVTESASITAIAQASGINDIFSRQLRALGEAGDILLCINSSSGADNLAQAIRAAHERNMMVVMMSNDGDNELGQLLESEDVEIKVPATRQARIAELHTMVINNLCELIDYSLFGTYNQD